MTTTEAAPGSTDAGSISGAEIRLDDVTKRYAGQESAAVDGLSLVIPAGEIVMFVGPSGLRQDHVAEDDQPADRAHVRDDPHRRHRRTPAERRRAAPHHRLRDPGRQPVPPHDGGQEHRDRAEDARLGRRPDLLAGRRAARAGQPRPREVPRPLPARALRRAAATRRRRARPGRRPAGDPDGRAVRRRRPDHPGAAAGRAALHPARAAQDDRLRHPRHRRGDQARRPDPDPPGGRPGRPVRHPRGHARQPGQRLRGRLRRRWILAEAAQPLAHLRDRAASADHRSHRRAHRRGQAPGREQRRPRGRRPRRARPAHRLAVAAPAQGRDHPRRSRRTWSTSTAGPPSTTPSTRCSPTATAARSSPATGTPTSASSTSPRSPTSCVPSRRPSRGTTEAEVHAESNPEDEHVEEVTSDDGSAR